LWDTKSGKIVIQRELGGNSFPNYSRDGKDLLVSGMSLELLDPMTGKETARNVKVPPSARQLVLSPDRRFVFSGRHHAAKGDVVAQMWDAKTGKAAPLPDAGQGLVTASAISPNGKFLATGGADGTIVIWDAERLAKRLDDQ
jgi:WD40 repeat protein